MHTFERVYLCQVSDHPYEVATYKREHEARSQEAGKDQE
jgi:hypothetical protein